MEQSHCLQRARADNNEITMTCHMYNFSINDDDWHTEGWTSLCSNWSFLCRSYCMEIKSVCVCVPWAWPPPERAWRGASGRERKGLSTAAGLIMLMNLACTRMCVRSHIVARYSLTVIQSPPLSCIIYIHIHTHTHTYIHIYSTALALAKDALARCKK